MLTLSLHRRLSLFIVAVALVLGFAAPLAPAAYAAPGAPGALQPQAAASELVQFTAGDHIVGFQPEQVVMAAFDHALRVAFVGAADVTPVATGAGTPATGETPSLGTATYPGLWPGIDVEYTESRGNLKSTYILAPGADPARLRLRYNVPVEVQADGSLSMAFERGTLTESAPVAWQEIAGQRVPVDVAFVVHPSPIRRGAGGEVGFRLGDYDPSYPLTIDPEYEWHTFYGGSSSDYGYGIAVDGSGNVYVTGYSSASWLGDGSANPLHAYSGSGSYDIVVVKLDSAGAYQWHTFYGGSSYDYGYGIAVDGSGDVVVTGYSYTSWLGDGSASPLHAYSGGIDIAVLKLDSAGVYQWHTFYGGSGSDNGRAVAVDGSGDVVVTGYSDTSWLGAGSASPLHAFSGGIDIAVLKLDSAGAYQWHTFYGSSGYDYGYAVAVDGSGDVVVTGFSAASWLGDGNASPLHAYSGNYDIVVVKLDSAGAYQWHTFYGGISYDFGYGIAVDGSGNVVVTGWSYATWQGDGNASPLHAYSGNYDIVVVKLDSAGAYQWHTFYGETSTDRGYAIAVNALGDITVAGDSYTTWLGDGSAAPFHAHSGRYDVMVLKLDSAGAYQWHTFYGSSDNDYNYGLALDGRGGIYTAGDSYTTWLGDGSASSLHAYSGSTDIAVLKLYDPLPITIAKSVDPASALPGQTITYTLNLDNGSPITVTNVVVTDTIPVSVTNTSVISSGVAMTETTSGYVWDVADMVPGASAVITITGTLTEPLQSGSFDNVATLTAVDSESNPIVSESTAGLAVLNVAPVAADDTATVDEDSTGNAIDVLANDTDDVNGDTLTVDSVTDPANGTAVDNDTDVLYTPDADFFGTDVFDYTVSDGYGGYATATITVTVNPVNDDPQAVDDAASVAQDSSDNVIDVLANDTDAPDSGETLSVYAVGDPANGTAVDNDTNVLYTPDAGFSGTDVFTYTVSDGNGGFATATVTVWVLGDVDLQITKSVEPTSAAPGDAIAYTLVFTNAGPGTAIAAAITDTIPVSVTGTSVISSSDVALVPRGGATYAWDLAGDLAPGEGGTITITGALVVPLPAGSFDNTAVITSASPDTSAGNDTGTVTLTVLNVDPVAADDAYTVDEDSSDNAFDVLANDSDPLNNDALTVHAVADPDNGTAVDNDTNVLYTPDADFFGTDVFTYTISDGNGGTDTATVTVTVTGINDPPVAVDDTYSTDEDTPLTVAAPGVLANDSDIENDPLTSVLVADVSDGTLDLSDDGSFVYTPTLNFNGTVTFTYNVGDGGVSGEPVGNALDFDGGYVNLGGGVLGGGSYTKEAWVYARASSCHNILSSNNSTQFWLAGNELAAGYGTTYGFVRESVSFPLNSWQHVAVTYDASTGEMVLYRNGTVVDSATGAGGYNDATDLHIGSHGGGCQFDGIMDEVRLWNVVRTPTEITDYMDVTLGGNEAGLRAYYTLNESAGSSVASDTTSNGFDGTLQGMNPASDWVPSTAPISAGGGANSNTATVTITVNEVNDDPQAVDDTASVAQNSSDNAIDVLANDTDAPDSGETLSVYAVDDPANGTAVDNDTDVLYTPDTGFSGTDVFTYTISDGRGGFDTATVTVSVLGDVDLQITKSVDPASAAPGEAVTYTLAFTNAGSGTAIDGVITDTIPVSVTGTSVISSSDVALVPRGGETYAWDLAGDLAPGEGGTITISGVLVEPLAAGSFDNTAVITSASPDTAAGNNSSTVGITVLNVAPVAGDDAYTVDEDTSDNALDVLANDTDTNGDSLTVDAVADPDNGTAVDNNTSVLYTPDANFFGTDVFTYTVSDGNGGTDTATVTVTVNSVNDPPTVTINSITPYVANLFADVTIDDADNDPLSGTVEVSGGSGTPVRVTFETLATCDNAYPLNLLLNGGLIGTSNSAGCTCTPGVASVDFTGPEIAANYIVGSDNTWTYNQPRSSSPYTAWARAIIHYDDGSTQNTCLFDYNGGDCTETNLCTAGYTAGPTTSSQVLPSMATVVASVDYTNSQLPAWIDVSGAAPGDYDLRVTADDGLASAEDVEPFTLDGEEKVYFSLVPDVAIVKTVDPASAAPGEAITYTLTFVNEGATTATGVVITDTIPASVTNTSVVSSGVAITQMSPGYVWAVEDLDSGEGGMITITGTLVEPLAAGSFDNVATIAADSDADPTNNASGAGVTVLNAAPVAVDDGYTTGEDTPLNVSAPGALDNDSDPNGESMTAVLDTDVQEGALALNGDGSFAYTPTVGWTGEVTFTYHITSNPHLVTSAGFGTAPFDNLVNSSSYDVDLGDVDGDGDLDAVFGAVGAEYVWLNQGGAQGGTPGDFTQFSTFGGYSTQNVDLGDLDGDGDLDAITANSGYYDYNYVYLNNGSGTFSPYDNLGGYYSYAYDVDLGDVDGDGDLDAVFARSGSSQEVHLNDGTGNFSLFTTFGSGTTYEVDLGDLDGDGDLDAILAQYNANKEVWLNQGGAQGGTVGQFALFDSFATGYRSAFDVDLDDVDGDGDLDAVFAHRSNQPQEVWLNQGGAQGGTAGDFGTAPADSFGTGDTYEVDLGDLDDDGDLDAILANYNGNKEVWLNQGGAQGGTAGDFGTSAHDSFASSYRYAYDVELGDVDGDGALDAVFAHNNQYSEVWLNQKVLGWDSSNTATVTITVTPGEPPVAVDDAFEVYTNSSDNPLDVLANDADADSTFGISAVGDPPNGTATFAATTVVTYTPDTDFFGPDVFTYTISDGALTDTATVTVTVVPICTAVDGVWSVVFAACPPYALHVIPEAVTVTLDASVAISGDLDVSGTLVPGTHTFTLNGSRDQTISDNLTFYNLIVDKDRRADTVSVSGKLSVSEKLTLTSGRLRSASAYGDVEIEPDGIMDLWDDITVSGDWTNNGTFVANTYTTTFTSSGQQVVGGSQTSAFYNLEITPTAQVFLQTTPTVTGTVTNNGTVSQTQTVNNGTVAFLEFTDGASAIKYQGVVITTTDDMGAVSVAVTGNYTDCTSDPGITNYRDRCFRVTTENGSTAGADMTFFTTALEDDVDNDDVYQLDAGGSTWNALSATCVAADGASCTTNDPVQLNAGDNHFLLGNDTPTAVTLASFTASPEAMGIWLRWETASELDNTGFNLYRSESLDAAGALLNDVLVPVQNPGSAVGGSYALYDGDVTPGVIYYYWLETIDTSGGTKRYGPVIATIGNYRVYLPFVTR